jgi:hypothetical protein
MSLKGLRGVEMAGTTRSSAQLCCLRPGLFKSASEHLSHFLLDVFHVGLGCNGQDNAQSAAHGHDI